jgi:hypothetical protein
MFFSTSTARRIGVCFAAAALVAVALCVPGDGDKRALASPAAQQPSHDMFANRDFWYADQYSNNAADLFPLDRTYSTAGATLEEGESAPCAPIGSSIWLAYSADRAGRVDLTVEGNGFDAIVAVYEWDLAGDFIPSPPGADLISLGCDEESSGQAAAISIALTPGREYVVQIGSRAAGGDVRVRATCAGCAPPNDNFDRQHNLYLDPWQPEANRTTNTTDATREPGEPSPCGDIGATVWYSLYSGTTADIELSTVGSDFDTVLAVYRLSPLHNYEWAADKLELVACEDDGAGAAAIELAFDPERGSDYFVQAGGADGAGGMLKLSARCKPVCPPYQDDFEHAEYWEPPFDGYVIPTDGATLQQGEPRPCGDIGKTVWYAVTARGDTRIALDTDGSDFDTALAVYEMVGFSPPPGSFDLIDCDAGGTARVEFDAIGNRTYWVQAGGVDGASGDLYVSADCVPAPCPPFHDSIAQPYYTSRPQGPEFWTEHFDVRGATTEPGEPLDCGGMTHTAWWVMDVYDSEPLTAVVFDTRDSDFNTAIAVYEAPLNGLGLPWGAPPAEFYDLLTPVACAGEDDPGRARAVFDAVPGNRYYVQIGASGGAPGQLAVEVSCDGPCPASNDTVAGAWYVYPPLAHVVDTSATTMEPREPAPCGNIGRTVWYGVDGNSWSGGSFTVSTAGSEFATVIAVYEVAPWSSPPGGAFEAITCVAGDNARFDVSAGSAYLIQIGGVESAGGALSVRIDCEAPGGCQQVYPVDAGAGVAASGGGAGVLPPDTGSGGYKPGARD